MSEPDDAAEPKTPIEQAVEHAFDLFVYAPIGILFEGASLLPELIAKGKGQLGPAIEGAVNSLIKDGTYKSILDRWKLSEGAVDAAKWQH